MGIKCLLELFGGGATQVFFVTQLAARKRYRIFYTLFIVDYYIFEYP